MTRDATIAELESVLSEFKSVPTKASFGMTECFSNAIAPGVWDRAAQAERWVIFDNLQVVWDALLKECAL